MARAREAARRGAGESPATDAPAKGLGATTSGPVFARPETPAQPPAQPPVQTSAQTSARPPAARPAATSAPARLEAELRFEPPAPSRPKPTRAILLWVLSAPLVPAAVIALASGQLAGFVGDALGWGLIAAAAVLTRRDGAQETGGQGRRFSRGWQWPLRNLAAGALGLGTAVAAAAGVGHALPVAIAFGALAVLGYHLVYGLAPLRVGGRLEASDRESRAVAEALAEAEGRLLNIERAASVIANPELAARLGRIAAQGRGMLEQIAERPSDLRRARRFLTVFLEGAERVSAGYARGHHHAETRALEENFRAVLVNIEDQFIRQRERLRRADVLDLDVQIEVLKKQLEQEGIR